MTRLLSIQEAAEVLGYSVKGLRKIIDRSRAKANGARTRGPTIRFFQSCRGAPVRFKEEWIEEFIENCTIDPGNGVPMKRERNGKRGQVSQIEEELLDL